MSWQLVYTEQAKRDAKKLASSNLCPQGKTLLEVLKCVHINLRRHLKDWSGISRVPVCGA